MDIHSFSFPFFRLKNSQLHEMVNLILANMTTCATFDLLFSPFVFIVDGRSDFGPGRSKGGIYANGQ